MFLRVLEYYSGIMFLTTNRVGSFDKAFKSRIHLAVKYPALSHAAREDLWWAFISRAAPEDDLYWLDLESLRRLAAEELNGRQIKNIIRMAQALAVSENKSLGLAHIEMGVRAIGAFEMDYAEGVEKRKAEEAAQSLAQVSKRRRLS